MQVHGGMGYSRHKPFLAHATATTLRQPLAVIITEGSDESEKRKVVVWVPFG